MTSITSTHHRWIGYIFNVLVTGDIHLIWSKTSSIRNRHIMNNDLITIMTKWMHKSFHPRQGNHQPQTLTHPHPCFLFNTIELMLNLFETSRDDPKGSEFPARKFYKNSRMIQKEEFLQRTRDEGQSTRQGHPSLHVTPARTGISS